MPTSRVRSPSDDPSVVDAGCAAADRLGLSFTHVHTGLDEFAAPVTVALRTEAR